MVEYTTMTAANKKQVCPSDSQQEVTAQARRQASQRSGNAWLSSGRAVSQRQSLQHTRHYRSHHKFVKRLERPSLMTWALMRQICYNFDVDRRQLVSNVEGTHA